MTKVVEIPNGTTENENQHTITEVCTGLYSIAGVSRQKRVYPFLGVLS